MSEFVHLHCHTEYSLLDGAIRLGDLCDKAKEFGMDAVAITDHGNLYGALKFYITAKKAGLKPIIGCEVYVAHTSHEDRTSEQARIRYHLVLLAQNLEGYRNLTKIVSKGCLDGFHYKPRVDKEILRAHSEGLIALSACLAGEVPRKLMNEGFAAAEATAREYAEIYPDRFYLELQSNGLKEQVELNEKLIELSRRTGLPLVATNDCHYLTADDVEAHDILLCIQTAKCVDDEKRMRFETSELYYKSPEEMRAAFADVPEAVENTAKIAAQCNVEFKLRDYRFPVYRLPEGKTVGEVFEEMSRAGLKRRLERHPDRDRIDHAVYWARLEEELGVIKQMGFQGYFLIVQDFINWAKDHKIPVGPGRGSAAGSIVAWALRITNLDPLPYNLLFERFLNPERVSMPDIDVDFCERRRTEVIRYVSETYGEDSVAQITTFGKMKAKAVVRDVGRALGMSFGETDRIAKLIPDEMKMTIDKALEKEPELRDMAEDDPRIGKLIDISRRLEGLSRHASTHAAGVVIGDKPLNEYLPLYRGKKQEIVTQFDMKMVEEVGLIKFDFLGLRTMTVVQDTLDIIAQQGIEPPDLDNLALDDREVYALYTRGDTDGVFQVESSGMRKYLRMLKPSCFDDIIAMLALYRPGPLNSGMVDEFIKRKHGELEVTYPIEALEPTLKDTYGVIVYQEQVMKIAQVVASYTLGGADLLRRAMGKKNAAAMAEQRAIFLEGAKKNDVEPKKAGEIFDLMEQFAEYGFNKSHSAAYALISYYTAYLKAHHPKEFMAALMTSELGNQDKILKYIGSCRDMGIGVRPPDVNVSLRAFSVRDGKVVFGLGAIKNVGDEAIREVVAAREQGGPFTSLLDLCVRVNLRKVTKRVLEHFIKSGAMDGLGCTRAALFAALDPVVARAQKKAKEKESGQISLLAMTGEEPAPMPGVGFDCPEKDVQEWDAPTKSRFEKDALGFFLTSHPLMPFRSEIRRMGLDSIEDAAEMGPKSEVKLAVLVTGVKEYITKKGTRMAFTQVEDLTGSAECTFFPDAYSECKALLNAEEPLLLHAHLDAREEEATSGDEEGPRQVKLLAERVEGLAGALAACMSPVQLEMRAERLENGAMAEFRELLERHRGPVPVKMHLFFDDKIGILELGPKFRVDPGNGFERDFEAWKRGAPETESPGDAATRRNEEKVHG
ncbi:MAG: DNA polymerase III subunit alpha [Desulfovibrionaceae bacterium]|jgi:DNA polymerase-3 subunit alpha|nr:DNA polymerase III subunit alpha [Desulfovibrionaceae bacterium]